MFVSITDRLKKGPEQRNRQEIPARGYTGIWGGKNKREGQFNPSPFFKQDLSAVAALIGWKVNNF